MRGTGHIVPALTLALLAAASCAPTVKVAAPDKPIHLKVDIKISQEVRVKVENDVGALSVEPAIPLAKRAGWIGERVDGYLGAVSPDTPADVRDIVLSANEDRHARFVAIAEARGAPLDVVERVAGRKFIAESAPGDYVQNDDGVWVKKP